MTPTQSLLHALGWSREYAASRLGCSPSTMRYWCEGLNSRGNPATAPFWAVARLRAYLAAVDSVTAEP